MKNAIKKSLSVFLSLCMLLSIFGSSVVNAFANDFGSATNVTFGETYYDNIGYNEDLDAYRFTVPVYGKVTVRFGAEDLNYFKGNVWFGLYKSSNISDTIDYSSLYDYGCDDGEYYKTVTYSLSAGTYYLAYVNYDEVSGYYNIKFSYKANVGRPSSFKVSSRGTNSLKLSWTKVSGVNGYCLQRKSGDSWKTVTTTKETSYTVKNLSPSKAYYYRVCAYKTVNGKRYQSSWKNLTTATKPQAVNFSSVSRGKKSFTAKWKKCTCSGYQIQYSTSSKFKNAKSTTVSSSSTKKTVKGLKSKKKYYVRVRAYKSVDGTKYYGAWSKAKSVKTK